MAIKFYFYRALSLFGGKQSNIKTRDDIQFGELLVSGKNQAVINLETLPRVIEVKFKDPSNQVPCNNHHDKCSWEVSKNHHQYELIIKWNVGGMREIAWIAYF